MLRTALVFLIPTALFGAYPYYNPPGWNLNGDQTFASSAGGSKIATATIPAGDTEYELRMTLNIKASGGTFIAYLRATPDAIHGTTSGTFYSVEFADVQVDGTSCTGTLAVYQAISPTVTRLSLSAEPCKDGMTWRVTRGVNGMAITSDLGTNLLVSYSSIASGNPGFGAHDLSAGNGFASVSIGPADRAAPAVVDPRTVATSVSYNQVDMQWQGVADDLATAGDHNGSGIIFYQIYRGGEWLANSPQPQFSDTTVQAGANYSYFIVGIDHFYQYSWSQAFPVHIPATGGIDPRRTGVRTNGAYWGGNGEQIDLLSGNLNFTLPLLSAQGRGGLSVTFALNYNSANFRKDTAATWKLGRDTGYGFGWKLLAGSLAEYRSNWFTVDHYLFTDSTGAEYRLIQHLNQQQQPDGIWYSREGIYLRYDPSKNQLYFPDGSFWEFGAVSSGAEEDAGTMYPTKMQDSNGNFIALTYQTGTYAVEAQSSSRILTIEDSRGLGNSSFVFTYTTEATPHLVFINSIGPIGVYYSFSITSNVPLNSPFAGDSSTFGATSRLDTIANANGLHHNFTYNTNNSGELTKVGFPYGGSLAWQFRDFTFSDSRVIRDMQARTLNDAVNGDQVYAFSHVDNAHDYNTSNHYQTDVFDASGVAFKRYNFDNATGLQSSLWEVAVGTPNIVVRQSNLTWATDSDGNPYIGTSTTTVDPGTSNQQTARTDQTRDNYGNLVELKVYDYNNNQPARTYTNTYYHPGNYIDNRLLTSTVTPYGGTAITLATNYYDQAWYPGGSNYCGYQWGQLYGGTPTTAPEFDSTYNGNGSAHGNLTTAIAPGSMRCMAYDLAGVVLQTKDNLGHTVTSTPDSSHNYAVPSAITTGNLITHMTWNGAFQPTGTTNPNGAQTGLAYDQYARPANSTSPYGATTTITYTNPSGSTPATTTATTNGRWTKTTMDGFGRTVKVETGYGSNPGTTVSITETQYAPCGCTPMGKTKQVSVPRAPGGPVYWTVYTYDAIGRTTAVTQPNNSGTTQYAYSGNTVTVTDPAGKWKKFTTDAMGNLAQVNEPNPNGGSDYVTNYTYSALNQLLAVTMPRPSVPGGSTVTQTRTFLYYDGSQRANYDGSQRLQSVYNPENGTTSYTYNADGTMATKTDAKSQMLSYFYDTLGRLTQVNNGTTILRTLTYDTNGGYGSNLAGRLARVDYGSGINGTLGNAWTELYSYDPAGGMLKKKLVWSRINYLPASLEAAWTYDTEGKVSSLKYPNGTTYTYTFDSMARPLSLSDGTNTIASGATYGPAGEMTALQYAGITESRTYNEQKQLTGIGTNAGSITYSYSSTNNNGRITGSTTITGESVTYAYDSLNRLIAATSAGQWGLDFTYDGFGNRLKQDLQQVTWQGYVPTIQQSYDMTKNQLLGQTYDLNGNMLGLSYDPATFDVENRMVAYKTDAYDYAADNKRIYKYTPGTTPIEEVYFYAAGRKIATYGVGYGDEDQNGKIPVYLGISSYNVYFGNKLIVSNGQGVVLDRLGSVVARWTGYNQFEKHAYFPYGEERTSNGQPTANNRDKFGTYFRDASTGLDYADQRFYGSVAGRFLSPDFSAAGTRGESPQTLNLYAYTHGDPINFADPTGLMEQISGCGAPGTQYCFDDGNGQMNGDLAGLDQPGGGFACLASGFLPASTAPSYMCFLPAAAAAGAASAAAAPVRRAVALRLKLDCFWKNGTSISLGWTREMDWQVVDQDGQAFYGSDVPTVAEKITIISKTNDSDRINRNGDGMWSRSNNSISPNGVLDDYLSGSGNSGTIIASQSFYVNGVALQLQTSDGKPFAGIGGTSLNNVYKNSGVTIDGTVSPRPCTDKERKW